MYWKLLHFYIFKRRIHNIKAHIHITHHIYIFWSVGQSESVALLLHFLYFATPKKILFINEILQ